MMTDFDGFDYDYESEGNNWNWFYVTMHNLETGDLEETPWPVFSNGFDEAINAYQVLLIASKDKK